MSTNDATNWKRRLTGEVVPVIDGEADYGFYRVRTRDKTSWRAVAYWYGQDGVVRCRLDGRDLTTQQAHELWTYASKNPITHEVYTAVTGGAPWPDLNAEVTRSNLAPADDSLEGLRDAIDDLAREAERLIKAGAAKTEDEANQAADVANKLGTLRNRADKAREEEKRPHLQAGRDVDDKWRPIVTGADIYARLKEIVVTPFLKAALARKAAVELEARRVAAAAAEVARKAEEEAKIAAEAAERQAGGARDGEAAEAARVAQAEAERQAEAAHEAQAKAEAVASAPVTVGTRGRSVGLRSKTVVTIVDRAATLAFFADRQEITDLLQKMADRAIAAGIAVPGTQVSKDSKAA